MEQAHGKSHDRSSAPAEERKQRNAAQKSDPPCPLQTWGNLAVQGLLQPKLAVSQPDDPYEREADRMAAHVMGGGAARPPPISALGAGYVQRQCAACMESGPKPCCEDEVPVLQTKRESGGEGAASARGRGPDLSFLGSGGFMLPSTSRRHFEQRLGHPLDHVRLHTGGAAQAANAALEARAFTLGNHIAFASGQYAPNDARGQWLLAHELTHVIQQSGGAPLIQRLGDNPMTDEWVARRGEEMYRQAEAARRRHEAWTDSHRDSFHRALDGQATSLDEDIASSRTAVTRQRLAMLEAVMGDQADSPDPGASPFMLVRLQPHLPADILMSWRRAELSKTLLEAALEGGEVNQETAEALRSDLGFFFQSLLQATEAQESYELQLLADQAALREARRDSGRAGGTVCPTCHDSPAPDAGFDSFSGFGAPSGGTVVTAGEGGGRAIFEANPAGWVDSHTDSDVIRVSVAQHLLEGAVTTEQWQRVLREYAVATAVLDRLLLQRLPRSSELVQAFEYARDMLARQEEIRSNYPDAIKIPAVFYPNEEFAQVRDPETGEELTVANGIPWMFYLTQTRNPASDRWAEDFQWELHDASSAGRPSAVYRPSSVLMAVSTPDMFVDPPIELFEQLNHRLRFPCGYLYWTAPSGQRWSMETTEPWTVSDWLNAVGVSLGVLALVLGTAGYGTPAAVALVGSAAFGIGSTIANLAELDEYGQLTQDAIDRAALMIALDVISALTVGFGQVYGMSMRTAGRAIATGGGAARALRVAGGARRLWFLSQTASSLGDAAKLYLTGADFVQQARLIQSQANLTEEQRRSALSNLVLTSMLTGALTVLSLRGGIADLRRGVPMHIELDLDGGGATVRPPTPEEIASPSARPDVEGGVHPAGTDATAGTPDGLQPGARGSVELEGETSVRNAAGETHEFGLWGDGWITRCSDLCTNLTDNVLERMREMRSRVPPNSAHIEELRAVAAEAQDLRRAAREASRDPATLDGRREAILARARDLELRASRIEQNVSRELGAFYSSAPRDWPVRQVAYDTLPRDAAGNIDNLPPGIVYEFPGGHRVWRLEGGGIGHDSYIGPSHGRQHFEDEFYRPGEAGRTGHHRAHTLGQGTGFESPFAIPYAPAEVNLALQNDGIEEFLRGLRDQAPPGMHFHVITETHMRAGSLDLESIIYRVEASVDGNRSRLFEFNIDVGGTPTAPRLSYAMSSVTDNPELMDMMLSVDVPERVRSRMARGLAGRRGGRGRAAPPVQPKLVVGAVNDPLELEADRAADQVMAASTPAIASSVAPPRIQRAEGAGAGASPAMPEDLEQAPAGAGQALEPDLRHDMERRFGHSFRDVRVHTGSGADALARAIDAQAYTTGSDIVFAAGKYAPGTPEGRHLLAHELAHTIQQGKGTDLVQRKFDPNAPVADFDVPDPDAPVVHSNAPSPPTPDAPAQDTSRQPLEMTIDGYLLTNSPDDLRAFVDDLTLHHGRGAGHSLLSLLDRGMPRSPRSDDLTFIFVSQLREVVEAKETEYQQFLGAFEWKAFRLTNEILQSSTATVMREQQRYGLDKTSPFSLPVQDPISRAAGIEVSEAAKLLMAKREELWPVWMEFTFPGGAHGEPTGDTQAAYARYIAVNDQYKVLHGYLTTLYPILGRIGDLSPSFFRSTWKSMKTEDPLYKLASGGAIEQFVALRDEADQRLEDIVATSEGLWEDWGRVWKLPPVVESTKRAMRVAEGSLNDRLVKDEIERRQSESLWTKIALGVIQLFGALLAPFTGGLSLGVSVGIGISQARESWEDYQFEKAASGTDFDRARSLSRSDPSLFGLALDIVAVVFDVAGMGAELRGVAAAGKAAAQKALLQRAEQAFTDLAPLVRQAEAQGGKLAAETEEAILNAARRLDPTEALGARLVKELKGGTEVGREAMERVAGLKPGQLQPLAESRAVLRQSFASETLAADAIASTKNVHINPQGWIFVCHSPCTILREVYGDLLAGDLQLYARVERLERKAMRAAENLRKAEAAGDEVAKRAAQRESYEAARGANALDGELRGLATARRADALREIESLRGLLEQAAIGPNAKRMVRELDGPALERIMAAARGKDPTNAISGQLFEELMNMQIRELAAKINLPLEFIPGWAIRGPGGRQLTDGVLGMWVDGRFKILTVYEAKASVGAGKSLVGRLTGYIKPERRLKLFGIAKDRGLFKNWVKSADFKPIFRENSQYAELLRDAAEEVRAAHGLRISLDETLKQYSDEVWEVAEAASQMEAGQLRSTAERLMATPEISAYGQKIPIDFSADFARFEGVVPGNATTSEISSLKKGAQKIGFPSAGFSQLGITEDEIRILAQQIAATKQAALAAP